MNVLTAHCLLPLTERQGERSRLNYIDHAGLADGDSWRRRVRARVGKLAWSLFGAPRF